MQDLTTYKQCGQEAITYIQNPERVTGYLDLGSAEVWRSQNDAGDSVLVIMTSSGDAAVLPADALARLR